MSWAVLSIGSNVGDSLAHLRSVTDRLGTRLIDASPVYATAPWGGVEQQDFLNAIVLADDPTYGPYEWLRLGQQLEADADRRRLERWGPRSLDVDVITCGVNGRGSDGRSVDGSGGNGRGEISSDDPDLLLPHPRAHERAFVLVPWLDVDPEAVLRVAANDVRVADLLAGLDPAERAGVRRTESTLTPTENRGPE